MIQIMYLVRGESMDFPINTAIGCSQHLSTVQEHRYTYVYLTFYSSH